MTSKAIRDFDHNVVYLFGRRARNNRNSLYNGRSNTSGSFPSAKVTFIDQVRYIVDFFREFVSRTGQNDAERRQLVAEMVTAAGYGDMLRKTSVRRSAVDVAAAPPLSAPVDFTTHPPAKWRDRANRRETPPEFIRREYAGWLGKGLVQADIRQYDRDLYQALASWQYRSGGRLPDSFGLPTKRQMTDLLVAKAVDPEETLHDGERWRDRVRAKLSKATGIQKG